jgi:transcriptional regulator with XRE-family HTH domain
MRHRGVNAIDVHVGKRIKLARLSAGMTRDQVGRALSLTQQQIQQYEAGVARVGAERLFALAKLFMLPVVYFFEGVNGVATKATDEAAAVAEALSAPAGIRIARALAQIDDAGVDLTFATPLAADRQKRMSDPKLH